MFMPMLTKSLRTVGLMTLLSLTPIAVLAEDYKIMMVNTAPDNPQHANVFAPEVLRVQLSDTVTFVPTDTGHNTASKRGMIPDGAEPWNSPMDEEFSITFSVPGIYGYVCLPHYEMGMVGLILVGIDLPPRNFPHFNVEFAQPSKEQKNATESFYRGPDYWEDQRARSWDANC